MPVEYHEATIPDHLSVCVDKLWAYRGHLSEFILPGGSLDVVLHLGGAPRSQRSCAPARMEPRALIAGQLTRPLHLWTDGEAELVSARLTPSGLTHFSTLNASELTNSSVGLIDAEIASASTLDRLIDRLSNEQSLEQRLAVFSSFLSDHLRTPPGDRMVNEALRLITRSSGTLSIQALTGRLGISERTLQRRFLSDVGVQPKMFCRVIRMRHAVQLASTERGLTWASIAQHFGFSDQSHFVRECKELCGSSPGSLPASGSSLTEVALAPRGLSDD